MHFCNASCAIQANYACINWTMLDKKQGVHSDFLILLHLLFYFEVGRHSRVGVLEIFCLKTLFFLHFSSFCQLHRAFRSHFCGRCSFVYFAGYYPAFFVCCPA